MKPPTPEQIADAKKLFDGVPIFRPYHHVAAFLAARDEEHEREKAELRIALQTSEALVACKEYSEELLAKRAERAQELHQAKTEWVEEKKRARECEAKLVRMEALEAVASEARRYNHPSIDAPIIRALAALDKLEVKP